MGVKIRLEVFCIPKFSVGYRNSESVAFDDAMISGINLESDNSHDVHMRNWKWSTCLNRKFLFTLLGNWSLVAD